MAAIVHGGRDRLRGRAGRVHNVNVNSPLHFDSRMLEGLLAFADAGQAVIVTPFLLMGAMAPVSVPAALAQQTAEVLAGLALDPARPAGRALRHGLVPVGHRHAVRRRPRSAAPSRRFGLYASGQIARRFGLPWRSGGGTLTASQTVDFQAGYEAFNTLSAAFLSGRERVLAVRRLAGGRPRHLLREVRRRRRADRPAPAAVRAAADRRGQPGLRRARRGRPGRVTSSAREHTLAHFRECFWRPAIGSTENIDRWTQDGARDYAQRSQDRWRALLDGYEQPPLDDAVEAELIDYVERRARELRDPLAVRRGAAQPPRRQAS